MTTGEERARYARLLRAKFHPFIVYCLVFWSFGICVGFLGPTLWDLGCQTGTTLPTMTWAFFTQSLFIALGTVAAGLLNRSCSGPPLLLFGAVTVALTLALIPLCGSIYSLTVVLALMGFAMGILDTTGNVSMLNLMMEDVSPFLQAMHFCYGLGGFLAPLVTKPFLRDIDCSPLIDNTTAVTEQPVHSRHFFHMPRSLTEAQSKIRVHQAFIILALLQIPVMAAIVSLMVKLRLRCNGRSDPEEEEVVTDTVPMPPLKASHKTDYQTLDDPDEARAVATEKSVWAGCWVGLPRSVVAIILLCSLLLFLADGLQADFSGLVFSYGKLSIPGLESSEAAVMDATFWGLFAAGRLLGVFLALWLNPATILGLDAAGCWAAMLLLMAVEGSKTGLYSALVLFGLSLSSVLPSTLSLAEGLARMGPSATSVMVVGASLGEMVFPVVVGHLFDSYGPTAFVVSGNASTLAMLAIFALLTIASSVRRKEQNKKAKDALK